MNNDSQRDIFGTILVIAILGLLIVFSLWVLKPFLPALIWATMIAVATWPMMLAVQRRMWRRRWLAVVVMTLALLLVFVVPFSLAIGTLVTHADDITHWVKSLDTQALESPPAWVERIPAVGGKLAAAWRELASVSDLGTRIAPYAGELASWFLSQLGSFGAIVLQFLLTVGIAALLYANGEAIAAGVLRFARRLGGERAVGAVILAAQSIRGVALGVVVTAILQSVMGGLGLAIVGVPYAAVLTAVMFMLAVAQIGAVPVLACAVIWLFWKGDTAFGVGLLVWTVIVGTMDNVVRPMLIKRGADLPLLLILVGVIGGLVAFGLVGLFIGPIVLAVTYTLVAAWVEESRPDAATDSTPRP
ncbi:MAG: AI-2E family transporter YdiK [Planctomycetota bacterium]